MKPLIMKEKIEPMQVLYVRLTPENKRWFEAQTEAGNFKNLSDFANALIESLKKETGLKKAG